MVAFYSKVEYFVKAMVPNELKQYIQQARAAGATDQQILQELFRVGWKMTDLEGLLSDSPAPSIPQTMKVTKLGHCCLLIETKGKRILTDPGSYTIARHSKLTGINFVLFTHEHGDHFHLASLKEILKNNSQLKVFANTSVAELLKKENIAHTIVSDGQTVDLEGVSLNCIGSLHAAFHNSLTASSNVGFFIDDRLWYPGDAFTDPKRPVEILALPVAGPWMKIGEAIDYAQAMKPKIAFPVHDGLRYGATHKIPGDLLPPNGIEFVCMVEGDSREF